MTTSCDAVPGPAKTPQGVLTSDSVSPTVTVTSRSRQSLDCGIPDKKGINLSSIKREDAIGLHRRIHASCFEGYNQSGSGPLICQSHGEWKYDIVCTDINECLDDPCYNGGTCSNNDGSFKCTCAGVFTGALCNEESSD
eukprot:XP_019923905.1 PREDICTED: fibulin-7-like [Crassostrea gigas]